METNKQKKDTVITALTGKRGRISVEDLYEYGRQRVAEDADPETSLSFFDAISHKIDLVQSEDKLFLSKSDKIALISDLLYLKSQVDNRIKEFDDIETFEGE